MFQALHLFHQLTVRIAESMLTHGLELPLNLFHPAMDLHSSQAPYSVFDLRGTKFFAVFEENRGK